VPAALLCIDESDFHNVVSALLPPALTLPEYPLLATFMLDPNTVTLVAPVAPTLLNTELLARCPSTVIIIVDVDTRMLLLLSEITTAPLTGPIATPAAVLLAMLDDDRHVVDADPDRPKPRTRHDQSQLPVLAAPTIVTDVLPVVGTFLRTTLLELG